ncbi:MAG: glycine dehydrogenase, partial [Myxococcota bacterium]
MPDAAFLHPTDTFVRRHIGPNKDDVAAMLSELGFSSLDALIEATIPAEIRTNTPLNIGPERSENQLLAELRQTAKKNKVYRSYLGMGYSNCITPAVILRNILENPGWYTQYTPYQAEIAQGRLEMLLNFQTIVADLTGLPVANASLLDEGTAAAEAMTMAHRVRPRKSTANRFFIDSACHPQTIAVVVGRAEALGFEVEVGDHATFVANAEVFGCLLQYPTTTGTVLDYSGFCVRARAAGTLVIVAADILALTLLTPPGEFGADVAVGSTQRFGVPLGFGGPHAAYFATRDDFKRQVPGRIIGISKDRLGNTALRMALQTREQHIRRDRATSNICTAQVLLAVIAGAFGVYHGPAGLRAIAVRLTRLTRGLRTGLLALGHDVESGVIFDTIRVRPSNMTADEVLQAAGAREINLRDMGDGTFCIALDSTVTGEDINDLLAVFGDSAPNAARWVSGETAEYPTQLARQSDYLTHPTFHRYHSETEMLRYLTRLQSRDLSLAQSMIPLGSCTMKLNGTSEMLPVTWPEFGQIHPFAPPEQTEGYAELFTQLEAWLADITGFAGVSLQPNAGSQGEYAGLLVIRRWHETNDNSNRNVCLIPTSAHGTNPASAVMAGMRVVAVRCDEQGNIDIDDLRTKAEANQADLAALMVTYPSTHGVFEAGIKTICSIVHEFGGQVYMDGANMNAMVGLCRPGELGADVVHLNLHKTFCIPHGGGGPGMGPIGVAAHLTSYLPGHPVRPSGGSEAIAPVSAAPYGSPSILPISWTYIGLMGSDGLTQATRIAILNANYIAKRLDEHFPVLYRGANGRVAHECIIDLRPLKPLSGVTVDDIAKRLMDYGFHA